MGILKWISLVIHYSNLPFTGDDVGRNWRRELRGWEKGKEGLKSGGKNTPEAESNRYASLHLQDLKSWLPTMSNSPMRYSDSLPLLILSCISLIYIHSPTNRITSHHITPTPLFTLLFQRKYQIGKFTTIHPSFITAAVSLLHFCLPPRSPAHPKIFQISLRIPMIARISGRFQ